MTTSVFFVKCFAGEDVRRFKLDGVLGHAGLESKVADLYGKPNPSIKYIDDEGDLVTIACDEDLLVALEISPKLLRIRVSYPGDISSVPTISPTRKAKFTLRNGAVVELSLISSALERFGLRNASESDVAARISSWKLRDLVQFGLVTPEHAREVCEANGVKVPKIARDSAVEQPEKPQDDVPQECDVFQGWWGRGRGRGGRGRGGRGHWGRGHWGHHHFSHFPHAHPEGHSAFPGHPPFPFPGHPFPPHVHQEAFEHEGDQQEDQVAESGAGGGRLRARFVKHVTVEDGTVVQPGEEFTKTWQVRNESCEPWPENVEVVVVGGDAWLSLESSAPVAGSVAPNALVDVSIKCRAPSNPGNYQTFWRLKHVDGKRFGQRLWANLMVPSPPNAE